MLLMIDNYDSFTFNLVQYFRELGATVRVVRNDEVSVDDVRRMDPQQIVVSPGPCTPNQAGVSLAVIAAFAHLKPILGVCLGHQAIGQAFGGRVTQASAIMHGKVSDVFHGGQSVFRGLPSPFSATRYHSLALDPQHLPECLEIIAWSGAAARIDDIMGVRHRVYPVIGVQFHPESILSQQGHDILSNFLQLKSVAEQQETV